MSRPLTNPRRALAAACALALCSLPTGCALPRTVADLEATSPDADHGRPGWIQGIATGGSWIGGTAGGLVSIALLPISYPIHLIAREEGEPEANGHLRMWWAMDAGAAIVNSGLSWPFDGADFLCRRIYVGAPEVPGDLGDPEPIKLWAGPVITAGTDVGPQKEVAPEPGEPGPAESGSKGDG